MTRYYDWRTDETASPEDPTEDDRVGRSGDQSRDGKGVADHRIGGRQASAASTLDQPNSTALRFRKKPVEVEAIQWDGDNWDDVFAFTGRGISQHGRLLNISTREGTMTASPGDWIIRGVVGELYPCKPEIFEQTYDQVWA